MFYSRPKSVRGLTLAAASATTIATAVALAAAPAALAQDADDEERIVVTGSRIVRQDYTANSPIVTVDSETFENTSTIGVTTVLNQMPQFVPSVQTQFNTTDVQPSAQNTVGSATVSLRGLGSNRSLVLVDGRRPAPASATLAADTNAIPSSAIQRVEIISGGASAVYGADAVGGVVNFILKDNFEGFEFDARYGLSEIGDNQEFQVSGLFGANFDDGRGNVMMSLEHATRGEASSFDRDWYVDEITNPNVNGTDFWFSEPYIGRVPGATARPSQTAVDSLFPTLDPGTISPTATFYVNRNDGAVFTGVRTFFGASNAAGAVKFTGPFDHPDLPSGQWRKTMYDGSIAENTPLANISRPLERYTAFGRGRYALTDNIDVIAQTTYSRTKSETVLQYTAALGSNSVIIPHGSEIYTPSLSDPDDPGSATLAAYLSGGAYGLNCGPIGGCTESEAFPVPIEVATLLDSRGDGANADEDFTYNTALDWVGVRKLQTESAVFQSTFGFEGEVFDDWYWDATISHAETEASSDLFGDVSRDRYRAVASSPNFGRAFQQVGNQDFGGQRAGQASCTTGLPLFENFEVSQDCRDAVFAVTHNDQNITMNVFEANLAGDLFDLPAGTVSTAVGVGYRDYDFEYNVDNLQRFNAFIENGAGIRPVDPTYGYYSVEEIYGELLIPVLSDLPGIQQLDFEVGGRYSDYSTVGGVETYKFLADWTVNDWVRVRGGYNRATRAPNIAELFQARTSIFTGSAAQNGDQCSQNNNEAPYGANADSNVNGATGAAFALDLCRAIMGDAAATYYYDDRTLEEQPDADSGAGTPNSIGNPDVQSETADTYTLGLVLQSPFRNNAFLSGFSGSVDYFTIELTDMIAAKNPDTVYQECLDPAINTTGSVNTLACQSIKRDLITGAALNVDTGFTNEGRSVTSGVDVQVDWRGEFADLGLSSVPGGMSVNVLSSFNVENTTQESALTSEVDWKGTEGCGLGLECMRYDYRVFSTFNYFNGPFSASLRWRHYPSLKDSSAATNPDTTTVGVVDSYDIFALSGSYALNDTITLRAGVENLLDEAPPIDYGNPNSASYGLLHADGGNFRGTYDVIGRSYFVGVNASF